MRLGEHPRPLPDEPTSYRATTPRLSPVLTVAPNPVREKQLVGKPGSAAVPKPPKPVRLADRPSLRDKLRVRHAGAWPDRTPIEAMPAD